MLSETALTVMAFTNKNTFLFAASALLYPRAFCAVVADFESRLESAVDSMEVFICDFFLESHEPLLALHLVRVLPLGIFILVCIYMYTVYS